MPAAPRVVAVFNSSDDILEILQAALEGEGFQAVAGHIDDIKRGRLDLLEFVKVHAPDVIVYDVGPPHEQNWRFLQLLRDAERLKPIPFVLTTTNKAALEQAIGPNPAHELLGKPFDLDQLVAAVARAATSRPSP